MNIKPIETKEEWLKLIIDGAKGVSNGTKTNQYVVFKDGIFKYNKVESVRYLSSHSADFGIVEEPKTKIVKEYIKYYKGRHKLIITDSDVSQDTSATYVPTGRKFEVKV